MLLVGNSTVPISIHTAGRVAASLTSQLYVMLYEWKVVHTTVPKSPKAVYIG